MTPINHERTDAMTKPLTADDIELSIDPEFRQLIPAPKQEQQDDLAESVSKYGRFLDPIRYWVHEDRNIILDGHQRYDLWCSLPDETPIPPPTVEEMSFPHREAAMEWMELYQLGRRNLDARTASLIRGRMYQRRKGRHGGDRKTTAPDRGPEKPPCAKPDRVMNWMVERVSTDGETILDPFMGSGTTGVAAVRLKRNFIGIELDPKYFEIAKGRIMDALGMEVANKDGTIQKRMFTPDEDTLTHGSSEFTKPQLSTERDQ